MFTIKSFEFIRCVLGIFKLSEVSCLRYLSVCLCAFRSEWVSKQTTVCVCTVRCRLFFMYVCATGSTCEYVNEQSNYMCVYAMVTCCMHLSLSVYPMRIHTHTSCAYNATVWLLKFNQLKFSSTLLLIRSRISQQQKQSQQQPQQQQQHCHCVGMR